VYRDGLSRILGRLNLLLLLHHGLGADPSGVVQIARGQGPQSISDTRSGSVLRHPQAGLRLSPEILDGRHDSIL
jgi:hypothetical protein